MNELVLLHNPAFGVCLDRTSFWIGLQKLWARLCIAFDSIYFSESGISVNAHSMNTATIEKLQTIQQ